MVAKKLICKLLEDSKMNKMVTLLLSKEPSINLVVRVPETEKIQQFLILYLGKTPGPILITKFREGVNVFKEIMKMRSNNDILTSNQSIQLINILMNIKEQKTTNSNQSQNNKKLVLLRNRKNRLFKIMYLIKRHLINLIISNREQPLLLLKVYQVELNIK